MELSDITFSNITDEDYNIACLHWYKKTHTNERGDGRFSIVNPFVSYNYERLLEWFISKDFGFKVSENDNGRWRKFHKEIITAGIINEIGNIARNDHFDGCNLELYFKVGNFEIKRPEICKLKFAKRDEKIISYHVMFMGIHQHLFSFKDNTGQINKYMNNGLYIPS